MTIKERWSYLFGFQGYVDRRAYLINGLVLALIKYLGEMLLYYIATGNFFGPGQFLSPLATYKLGEALNTEGLLPALCALAAMLWSLPFAWIGVSMSIRRCADAGRSPWWGLAFFLPVANLIMIAVLVKLPSSPKGQQIAKPLTPEPTTEAVIKGFLWMLPLVGGVCLTVAAFTFAMQFYGAALFILCPFLLGLLPGFHFRSHYTLSFLKIYSYVVACHIVIFGTLLLLAAEGVICLLMAAPLSLVLAALGVFCGKLIAELGGSSRGSMPGLLVVVPLISVGEYQVAETFRSQVVSEITIDAPIERVWHHVISFSEIPEPREFIFRAGIAAPLRATIAGTGVGAIRRCEFTTGAFIEPITRWDEPHYLGFSVKEQPQPLRELSFYEQVNAPHLHGFFQSERGAFELAEHGKNQTVLRGTTWYRIDIHPGWYWQIYGHWFISTIHKRVLEHIANLAQAA